MKKKQSQTHPKNGIAENINIIENTQSMRIKALVVDDDKSIRDLLCRIISESTDYFVEVAENGEEGFKKYKRKLHQLIILDIRLGGKLSGVDLLKKLKKHDKIVNVIMITGFGTIDLAVECMKAGAYDFITKPFSYDHFLLILRRACENIVLQKRASERDYFFELSRIDDLTEVYNRRLFELILDNEIARAKRYKKRFCLLLMDMDDFKSINDQFGHQKGDEVLKTLAYNMKAATRASDYLFRYGGDEFAVILPETGKEGAIIYAKRLKEKVESLEIQGSAKDGQMIKKQITLTLGVVIYPNSGLDKKSLIHCVDMALLEAKRKSKNQIVFQSN